MAKFCSIAFAELMLCERRLLLLFAACSGIRVGKKERKRTTVKFRETVPLPLIISCHLRKKRQ